MTPDRLQDRLRHDALLNRIDEPVRDDLSEAADRIDELEARLERETGCDCEDPRACDRRAAHRCRFGEAGPASTLPDTLRGTAADMEGCWSDERVAALRQAANFIEARSVAKPDGWDEITSVSDPSTISDVPSDPERLITGLHEEIAALTEECRSRGAWAEQYMRERDDLATLLETQTQDPSAYQPPMARCDNPDGQCTMREWCTSYDSCWAATDRDTAELPLIPMRWHYEHAEDVDRAFTDAMTNWVRAVLRAANPEQATETT